MEFPTFKVEADGPTGVDITSISLNGVKLDTVRSWSLKCDGTDDWIVATVELDVRPDDIELPVELVQAIEITNEMVTDFDIGWNSVPIGQPGARRRAGLKAALNGAGFEVKE